MLRIDLADVVIVGDMGDQWASVKFQAGSQMVEAGAEDTGDHSRGSL